MGSQQHDVTWIFFQWQVTSESEDQDIKITWTFPSRDDSMLTTIKNALYPQFMMEIPLLEMAAFLPLTLSESKSLIAIVRYRAELSEGRSILVLLDPTFYLRKLHAQPITVLRTINENWDHLWEYLLADGDLAKKNHLKQVMTELSFRSLPFNPVQVIESLSSLKRDQQSLKKLIMSLPRDPHVLFLDHGKKHEPELFLRGVLDLFPATVRIHFSSIFPAIYVKNLMKATTFKWKYMALPREKDLQQFYSRLKQDQIQFDVIWDINSGVQEIQERLEEDYQKITEESWYFSYLSAQLEAVRDENVTKLEQVHQKMMQLDQIAVEYEYLKKKAPNSETWRNCLAQISQSKALGLKEYEMKFQELALEKATQTSLNEGIIALTRLLQDEHREDVKVTIIKTFLGMIQLTDLAQSNEQVRISWYRFLLKELKNAKRTQETRLERQLFSLLEPTITTFPLTTNETLEFTWKLLAYLHENGKDVESIIRHHLFNEQVSTAIKIELFTKSLDQQFMEIQDPLDTFNQLMNQVKNTIAIIDIANVFLHRYPRDFRTDTIVDPIINAIRKIPDLALHFEKIVLYARLITDRFSLKRQHLDDQLKKLVKPLTTDKQLQKEVKALFNDLVWNPQAITNERIEYIEQALKMAHYQRMLRTKMEETRLVTVQLDYLKTAMRSRDPSLMLSALNRVLEQDPKSQHLFLVRSREMLSLARDFRRNGMNIPLLVDLRIYHHVIKQLPSKYRKTVTEQVLEEWLIDIMEYLTTILSRMTTPVTIDAILNDMFQDLLKIISKERDPLKKKTYLLYMITPWLRLENHDLFTKYLEILLDITHSTDDWDYFLEWLNNAKKTLTEQKMMPNITTTSTQDEISEISGDLIKKNHERLLKELEKATSSDKTKKRLKIIKKTMTEASKSGHKVLVLLVLWDLITMVLNDKTTENTEVSNENER